MAATAQTVSQGSISRRTFERLSGVKKALGQSLGPAFNGLQPLPECSRSNRWRPGCKLLFLPCLHSGKVADELLQLDQRRSQGFLLSPRANDPAERTLFPSHAVVQSGGVRCPAWSQKVTGSFALLVFGFVAAQLPCDALSGAAFLKKIRRKNGQKNSQVDIIYVDWNLRKKIVP